MSGLFTVQIKNWGTKAASDINTAFALAVVDLVKEINRPIEQGGSMPKVTGRLKSSVSASSVGPPRIIPDVRSDMSWETSVFNAAKAAKKTGNLWVSWTAPYANRIEFGFVGYDSLGRYYRQVGRAYIRNKLPMFNQLFLANLRTLRAYKGLGRDTGV